MSVESAEKFLSDLESNSDLRNDFYGLFNYDTGKWDGAAVAEKAKGHGYDFNVDDLEAAAESTYGEELTEEQLEMISGGGCCCSCCIATCCCCSGSG